MTKSLLLLSICLFLPYTEGHQSDGHCGTRDPGMEVMDLVEKQLEFTRRNGDSMHRRHLQTRQVPVSVHIFQDGNDGQVTDGQIADQVAVLNTSFQDFTFVLRETERIDDPSFFAQCNDFGFSNQFKSNFRENNYASDGADVLHVYVCDTVRDGGGLLGQATFPWTATEDLQVFLNLDGIILGYNTLPGGDLLQFSEGFTLVHEVGHWLGLYHPFHGGCQVGDNIDDTPAQAGPRQSCPIDGVDLDTCPGEPGIDIRDNFMDYEPDNCPAPKTFTEKQRQRMTEIWDVYRDPEAGAGLANSACADAIPIADGQTLTSQTTFGAKYDLVNLGVNSNLCPEFTLNSPGVYYRVSGTGGEMIASLCNEPVDTILAISVLEGSCGQQVCIKSRVSRRLGCTSVEWQSSANVEYTLYVHGENGGAGNFVIDLAQVSTPINDSCENAIPLTSENPRLEGTTHGATVTYTGDLCGNSLTSPEVWYSIEPPVSGLTLSTCFDLTSFGAAVTILRGRSCSELTCMAYDFDDATLCGTIESDFPILPDTKYYVIVHGSMQGEEGDFLIEGSVSGSIDSPAPTPNTGTPTPTPQTSLSPSISPTVARSDSPSVLEENPTNTPSTEVSASPTVVPSELSSAMPSTDESSSPSTIPSLAGSEAPSSNPSQTPSLVVSSLPTSIPSVVPSQLPTLIPTTQPSGNPTLIPTFTAPPNNLCKDAIDLELGIASIGTNKGASVATGRNCNFAPSMGKGVWYKVRGTGEMLVVTTCSDSPNEIDTNINLYSGTGCGSLVCRFFNGNTNMFETCSTLTFDTLAGQDYYILVHSQDEGAFSVKVARDGTVAPTIQPSSQPTAVPSLRPSLTLSDAPSASPSIFTGTEVRIDRSRAMAILLPIAGVLLIGGIGLVLYFGLNAEK